MAVLLTFAEVLGELRISEHTLRALIASGSLRAGKIGRQWRIRRDDLDAYLEAIFAAQECVVDKRTAALNGIGGRRENRPWRALLGPPSGRRL